MDSSTAIFVDGLGAAAATSGILNQLQGCIFAQPYFIIVDGYGGAHGTFLYSGRKR